MSSQQTKLSLSSKLAKNEKQQKISTFFGAKNDSKPASNDVNSIVVSSDDEDEIAFMGCRPISTKTANKLSSKFGYF